MSGHVVGMHQMDVVVPRSPTPLGVQWMEEPGKSGLDWQGGNTIYQIRTGRMLVRSD